MSRRLALLSVVFLALVMVAPVMAQEHGAAAGASAGGGFSNDIFKFIGAAFAIGMAAAFGSLGQGRGLSSACEAIGRNPGAVGPIRITMIIGLALIESLVIYALVVAIMILTA
jgi:F-type H+-transporting ATPase subunit c